MDTNQKKEATILGIVYHPEIRPLSEQCKKDIAVMVDTLVKSLDVSQPANPADGQTQCPYDKECSEAEINCSADCRWGNGRLAINPFTNESKILMPEEPMPEGWRWF